VTHHLSIDLETYSSIPIKDVGAQAYLRSPDFEILLFGYSLDGAPPQVIDLACGERLPAWLIDAIVNPSYIKHAYNAAFEWGCLSRYFSVKLPPEQWRDTMLHAMYCGYPASLAAVGQALGLPEDRAKLNTGKALIRYFCVPSHPKSTGKTTRHYPNTAPDKWELFKEYNAQDVVAEMEVENLLSNTPVPDFVQKQWETDLIINDRGVAVDMDFVHGALELGATIKEQLTNEAIRISGLSNPNSVKQLSEWLQRETGEEVNNLQKKTVAKMLDNENNSGNVSRMLEIRQELGKTSMKKYDAIQNCVCEDGRVRGLLQFYGANRTGRWAGRLVQVQNLPRTYTQELNVARELVKKRNLDGLRVIYGSPNDTLSQLIRTAFIAPNGHVLIDADFSAIEARVISWLAGQEWRLDVFRKGGDIYCASASQMFHVNVVKGGENGHLRQKGKVAELALGYQGSTGALINMGALDMGISEEDLPDIVNRWREANSKIRDLWYTFDSAAVEVIKNGGEKRITNKVYDPERARENEALMGVAPNTFSDYFNGGVTIILRREYDSKRQISCLTMQLPSGRKLYYVNPLLGENRWGSSSITYLGVNDKNKWARVETYGGKLVENCVQAIARDCLALAIERLEAKGLPVVFHVHDEVIIDIAPFAAQETMLKTVIEIMTLPIQWAPGLPLGADGWVGTFFKKD